MNVIALALAVLLAVQDPSEVDKLKVEVEKLKADNAALKTELEKKRVEEKFKAATLATAEEHYRRAESLYQKREIEEALAECAKALQADPGSLPARSLRTEL